MALARIDGVLTIKCSGGNPCDTIVSADSPETTHKEFGDQLIAQGWRFMSGWHFCPKHSGAR